MQSRIFLYSCILHWWFICPQNCKCRFVSSASLTTFSNYFFTPEFTLLILSWLDKSTWSKQFSNKFNEKCIMPWKIFLLLFCFVVHKNPVFAFHTLFTRNWNILLSSSEMLIRNISSLCEIKFKSNWAFVFLVLVDSFSVQ